MTIQPHHSATIAAAPETETARRNHGVRGMSRRFHQTKANQAPRPSSAEPIPTIASKERCSSVWAGGSSSSGMSFSPVTSVSVFQPTRKESRPGMPIAPFTPSSVQMPPRYSVWSGPVS